MNSPRQMMSPKRRRIDVVTGRFPCDILKNSCPALISHLRKFPSYTFHKRLPFDVEKDKWIDGGRFLFALPDLQVRIAFERGRFLSKLQLRTADSWFKLGLQSLNCIEMQAEACVSWKLLLKIYLDSIIIDSNCFFFSNECSISCNQRNFFLSDGNWLYCFVL